MKNFDWIDLPDPTKRGFVVIAKESDRDCDIPDFLGSTVLYSDCPRWITNAAQVVSALQSYRLIHAEKAGELLRRFVFAPNLTQEQTQTPYRSYFETEPSMFWPKVLLSLQGYRRVENDAYIVRPRYKEAYQGPTRVLIEEFYSPTPFEIPAYEPMVERGLHEEIGVSITTPIVPGVPGGGQSFWLSIGSLNLEPCLHSAIAIVQVIDPPLQVGVVVYNFAYLNDPATNYIDWPERLVIDDRQNQVLGGWLRRRVWALRPIITRITAPTSGSLSYTLATLGGTVATDTNGSIVARGVVFARTAQDANPEVGNSLALVAVASSVAINPAQQFNGTASGTNLVVSSTTGMFVGQTVTGTAFNGTVAAVVNSTNVTLSGSPTAGPGLFTFGTTGAMFVTGVTNTNGSATLTLATAAPGLFVGQPIAESGIPFGATITAISANGLTVTMSAVSTAAVTAFTAGTTGTTGIFTVAVAGLRPSTAYSFKPWALTSQGVRTYGPLSTFATLSLVSLPTSASITSSGATLGGTLAAQSEVAVTDSGVVYALTATNADPEHAGTGVTTAASGDTSEAFTVAVTGLTSVRQYTFKPWALLSDGVRIYGPAGTFTTLPVVPTVTTPTSANVTDNDADLGGNVTSDGGGTVTARGVVYSLKATNPAPQIDGEGVTNVVGAGTTDVFTVYVPELVAESEYSYAAYATNSAGTAYSSVGTFTTAAS
jgi:hypothetical protein